MKKIGALLLAISMLIASGACGVLTAYATTEANDGKFYSDYLTYDEMLKAGRAANEEIVGEGVTLLKNINDVLPFTNVKRISVFGKNSVDPYYHGFGAGAAQSTLDPISLHEGLQMAGYETNSVLASFYENDDRSGSDRTIGELIGEAPVAKYDEAVKRSFSMYHDAAVVCISRAINEGKDGIRTYAHDQAEDPTEVIEKDRHYLELSKNEKDMIEYIKELGFEKIVVLINSANAFEVAPLIEDDAIDSVLWISSPGYDGFKAIGEILNGKINPSGHLVDTWYRDFTKDPTWQNFGDNSQTSADGKTANYQFIDSETGKPLDGVQYSTYVAYEEGIYVGYRYYETMYADILASQGKVAADEWYSANVVFPFGYGLSYTDFAVTNVETSLPEGTDLRSHSAEKITFNVTVKNTGSVAGKEVVQIYYHAPYIDGQIEKAEENLGAFAKTKLLKPGESQTLTLEIYVQDMASYDYNDANGNGKKGYELDAGAYQFRINKDAHDTFAVENSADTVVDYVISAGDAIYYPNDRLSGKEVSNKFDSTQGAGTGLAQNNYNSLPDPNGSITMTIMSRASANHMVMPQAPTASDSTITKDSSLYKKVVHSFEIGEIAEGDFRYKTSADAKKTVGSETVTFTQAKSADNREITMKFADMIGVESDDIKWEKFMNQLTWDECVLVVTQGRKMAIDLPDFEMPSAWHDNGPTCCQQVDYGSGNILAATWNVELAKLMGKTVGNECLWIGMHGWYGPSINIHRSPFGGRNNEYFSEDGFLSGRIAATQIQEVQQKGVYVMAKHFALNEQETSRSGVATYVDEQTMREIYLKSFQMAVEEGKALGIMTAMNKVGDVSSYANYALATSLLRDEWGFNGFVVTDSGPTAIEPVGTTNKYPVAANFVNLWEQNISGNDLCLENMNNAKLKYFGKWDDAKQTVVYTPAEGTPVESTSLWLAVRESAKRIIFANAQSALSKNGVDTSVFTGTDQVEVGKDVEFYESIALESEFSTKDVRYFISEGTLPEGVTMSSAGLISGTATECGSWEITVTLQADSWNLSTKKVVLSVVPNVKIENFALEVGKAVNAEVKSDFLYDDYRRIGPIKAGTQLWWITLDHHFEIYDGALPAGLTLTEDGKITGTPTTAGEYTFTINVVCSEEASALKQYNTAVTPDYLTTFTVVVSEPSTPDVPEEPSATKEELEVLETQIDGKLNTLKGELNGKIDAVGESVDTLTETLATMQAVVVAAVVLGGIGTLVGIVGLILAFVKKK